MGGGAAALTDLFERDWPATASRRDHGELVAQLAFQLTNLLNGRGYLCESKGVAGVVFRRRARGLFYFGVALMLIGALAAIGGVIAGLVLVVIGAPLLWARRPATIAVDLSRSDSETRMQPRGGFEPGVTEAIERAAGPSRSS